MVDYACNLFREEVDRVVEDERDIQKEIDHARLLEKMQRVLEVVKMRLSNNSLGKIALNMRSPKKQESVLFSKHFNINNLKEKSSHHRSVFV